ncbi:MAG: acetoin utilization protein AcuC [Ignavibacteriales bacterium CG18_big_fil_WC_8_21_14_2_50_31_20]|nr:MAG: acetoin utilization protein AcuC [Ignavibacteriales bacterium CG18_big_fil_WC_8_21_14_2_50_31_20]
MIYNPKYSLYNLGESHPFSPQRTEMLIELLKEWNILTEPIEPNAVLASDLEVIHDRNYINTVEKVSSGINVEDINKFGLGNADNPIFEGMAEGARYQVGGTVLGAKLLMENKANRILQLGGGFHHAHNNFAAGFCIYNDLSLAINEMVNFGWHVVYLDIDVHHGDGVQEMFYSHDYVMTISIHESGEFLFPGKGWVHELGQGSGRALKMNVPLEPFSEGSSYLEFLDKVLKPALSWFKPNALVVQAGADAHFADPLADNLLTTHDYENIFRQIIEFADKSCNGKVLFTLGGGYSSTATPRIWALLYLILNNLDIPEYLPKNWKNHWEQMLGKTIPNTLHDKLPAYEIIPRREEILKINKDVIRRLMDSVSQYWI